MPAEAVLQVLRMCHNGVTVGGQMYQRFGLTADY